MVLVKYSIVFSCVVLDYFLISCLEPAPMKVKKIYFEKKSTGRDLDSSATGYIYRDDGNGAPPVYIQLGNNNVKEYDGVLKDVAGFNDRRTPVDPFPKRLRTAPPRKTYYGGNGGGGGGGGSNADVIYQEAFKHIPENVGSPEQFEINADIKIPEVNEDTGEAAPYGGPPNYSKLTMYKEERQLTSQPYVRGRPGNDHGYVASRFEVPSGDDTYENSPQEGGAGGAGGGGSGGGGGGEEGEEEAEDFSNVPVEAHEYARGGGSQHLEAYAGAAEYHHPEKHHFKKGGGKSYEEDHKALHGEKGKKGFKKYHDFKEDEGGHHHKDKDHGYHKGHSGFKKDHHDEGEKHKEFHGGHKGHKGHSYDEGGGYKKGHNTKGHHNVFHKDEFKKEHKFFDDAYKHGHHKKHGGHHESHAKKHGGHAKHGHHDHGFEDGHKGHEKTYKKGHFDKDHHGHKGSSGHESHFKHHEDYGKKHGHKKQKKHGYDDHHA